MGNIKFVHSTSIMLSLVVIALAAQVCSAHEASSYGPRIVVDQAPVVWDAAHASELVYENEPVHTQRLVVQKPVVHTAAVQYVEPVVHLEPAVHLEHAVRVEPVMHMEPVHVNPTLRVEHVYQPEIAHSMAKSVKLYKRPVTSLKRPIVSYKVPVDSYAQFVDGADYGYESRHGEIGPLATTGRYSQFVGKPSRVLFRMAGHDAGHDAGYDAGFKGGKYVSH